MSGGQYDMDEIPLSKNTVKRAHAIGLLVKKHDMGEANGIMEYEQFGDMMLYMFANKSDVVIVYCSPYCYMVAHGPKNSMSIKGSNYLLVSNIGHFVQTLKKQGYVGLTERQLKSLQKRFGKRPEREPKNEELKQIEEEENEEHETYE